MSDNIKTWNSTGTDFIIVSNGGHDKLALINFLFQDGRQEVRRSYIHKPTFESTGESRKFKIILF